MSKYNSRARKLDLSAKFLEMGVSLQDESDVNGDSDISILGTILIFLSSLALSEEELYDFSELVSMYSAKRTLDNLTKENHPIIDMLKTISNRRTYEEIIDDLEKQKEDEEENEEENE